MFLTLFGYRVLEGASQGTSTHNLLTHAGFIPPKNFSSNVTLVLRGRCMLTNGQLVSPFHEDSCHQVTSLRLRPGKLSVERSRTT